MADAKITIDSLPPVTLPLTGNENILVSQAGVAKVMKPGDVQAFSGSYIKQDGTLPFTGDQSMGTHKITDLAAPTSDNDAIRLADLNTRTGLLSLLNTVNKTDLISAINEVLSDANSKVVKVNGIGGTVQLEVSITGGILSITGGATPVNLDLRYLKTTDSIDWSKLISVPTTLAGYGITDAVHSSDVGVSVASLVGGVLPTSQLPALAITDTFVVASQAAQLALTAQKGDVCVRTDTSQTYINQTGNNTAMTDWVLLEYPAAPVLSVNGQTGTVVLGKADVGLGNVDNTSDINKPVSTAQQTALNLKANISSLATVATSGSYADLINNPTKLSQFTNDAGYLTTEADTLQSVTNRGATTTSAITAAGFSSSGALSVNSGGITTFGDASQNELLFQSLGVAPPSFTTRSAGTKIVLYPDMSGSFTDYAIGIDSSTMWQSIPAFANSYYFKWYGGTTNIATLDGIGDLSLSGTATSTKFITSGGTSSQFVKGDGSLDGTAYAPLTGTGASGTWGISITGNAATATNGLVSTGSYADPAWLTSLAYSKLTGAPVIPTNNNQLTNGAGYITGYSETDTLQTVCSRGTTTTTTITANAFYESSSRKLKKEIKDFTKKATDLLSGVSVKEFKFKNSETKHIGIIAEETDKVFSTQEKNKFDIASTVGVLIKGFQELLLRVEKLEGGLA